VSFGILFLFAKVLLEQDANPVQVRTHVAEQLHASCHVAMREQRLHGGIVPPLPKNSEVA
jgi:hypothetical protein